MNTRENQKETVTNLLANLWFLEYQDAAEEARDALCDGDKLKALALAIWANKCREKYEKYFWCA